MGKCYACGYIKSTKTVCSDCSVEMCKDCINNDYILCDCYGNCTECGNHVNRGDNGWPCTKCKKWLCNDCKDCKDCNEEYKGSNKCSECNEE